MQMTDANQITAKIIGCAIAVHKELGAGLLENIHHKALCIEMKSAGLDYESEKVPPVVYKGEPVGDFRADIIVARTVVVEIKSVERHEPVFDAQVLSYMKLGGYPLGLLLNFNVHLLKRGIKRFIL